MMLEQVSSEYSLVQYEKVIYTRRKELRPRQDEAEGDLGPCLSSGIERIVRA